MIRHGDSEKPTCHFGIPDYAQALDHACQILNLHRAHVIGNSVGEVLAIEAAASFPEKVDKLVLVGCPVWDVFTAKDGDFDRRFQEGNDLLHNNIVNPERVILPGLGHIPQVEDPEAFLEPLLPFLKT